MLISERLKKNLGGSSRGLENCFLFMVQLWLRMVTPDAFQGQSLFSLDPVMQTLSCLLTLGKIFGMSPLLVAFKGEASAEAISGVFT